MAIILSLLNIQKTKVKDKFHSQLFNEISDKVYSIAAVQEQLHTSDNIDRIDLSEYIKRLTDNLYSSYGQEKLLCIDLELDNVELDVSKAIPCGLIINEILTNSYKYAFDDQNLFPKLVVSLKRTKNDAILTIKDNGKGFESNMARNGMGLELIEGLAEQIDGEIAINGQNGVEIVLSFSTLL